MSRPSNFDKSLVEAIKLRRLELVIVEAKEIVHDDVARKCRKSIRQIKRLLASLELLDAHRKSINVPVNDVDEV